VVSDSTVLENYKVLTKLRIKAPTPAMLGLEQAQAFIWMIYINKRHFCVLCPQYPNVGVFTDFAIHRTY
jgi:hypothetical protein